MAAKEEDTSCPDCYVDVGMYHKEGCDWARCPDCKEQRICCDCGYSDPVKWMGWERDSFMRKCECGSKACFEK